MTSMICLDVWSLIAQYLDVQQRLRLMSILSHDHCEIVKSTVDIIVEPYDIIISDYLPGFKQLTIEYDINDLLDICCEYDAINCIKWLYTINKYALRHKFNLGKHMHEVHFTDIDRHDSWATMMMQNNDAFSNATKHGSIKILKWLWSLGYCRRRSLEQFVEVSIRNGHKEQIDWFNDLPYRETVDTKSWSFMNKANFFYDKLSNCFCFACVILSLVLCILYPRGLLLYLFGY